jgi:aspartate aminotransferase-like enzyme
MKTQKHLLFCPGPVNTAANVKDALISYEIGHREKEFEAIFKQLQNKILKAFEIKNRKAYTLSLLRDQEVLQMKLLSPLS